MSELHYVDTHCHLMGEEFQEDLEDVIARCKEKHVDKLMIITLSLEETKQAIEFVKRDPENYKVAAGIFPEDVTKVDEKYWNDFCELAKDPMVTAIGEIGLEYHWVTDEADRAVQREYFAKLIELAREVNKPILVHSRDAMQDTFDIMKKHHWKGLLHCFPGSKEMAKEFTKLGYYIALGGALTFKNARHSVDVVETIDLNYLLSETDAPYMAPVPVRGTRNEPSNIPYIVEKMAEIRNIPVEDMAAQIDANWTRFLEEADGSHS